LCPTDVAFDEMEAIVVGQIAELVVGEVDTVDLPVPLAQDRVGERAADEAVRPENHDLQCHILTCRSRLPRMPLWRPRGPGI
jgi:hypothetical protein